MRAHPPVYKVMFTKQTAGSRAHLGEPANSFGRSAPRRRPLSAISRQVSASAPSTAASAPPRRLHRHLRIDCRPRASAPRPPPAGTLAPPPPSALRPRDPVAPQPASPSDPRLPVSPARRIPDLHSRKLTAMHRARGAAPFTVHFFFQQ